MIPVSTSSAGPRGSGNTTSQIRNAPIYGLYIVWDESGISYIKSLADKLGRQDLKIISKNQLYGNWYKGLRFSAIVIDHHTNEILTAEERHILETIAAQTLESFTIKPDSYEKELDNFLDWLNFK